MDFLRLLSDDLQTLRSETKKKYPVVKEAVDKALETLPYLQKQYAALLRSETKAPGPGHALFKSESVLRPFLLACNHTNAPHKIIILALVSIQRLVSWDAIEQSSVGSILRVLQIQAEKNTHVDVQVKLLQTLLQLVTLGYQDKPSSSSSSSASSASITDASSSIASAVEPVEENVLVGSEDLVMQAIWICIHLHGGSSSASSVVGNTAAMTIRQVVSLAFGKVQSSPEAKRVGVLVFQELCFMGREENGAWLKRTATSPMSVALGVELLETILAANAQLFRDDTEFYAVLKQHVCSLIQSALETGCSPAETTPTPKPTTAASLTASALSSLGASTGSSSGNGSGSGGGGNSGSGGGGGSGNGSGSGSGFTAPFFPLLVRVMRLASVVLSNFSDVLPDECTVVLKSLLEIVATGAYYQPGSAKSPSHAKLTAQDAKSFLTHHLHHSSSLSGSAGMGGGANATTSSSSGSGSSGHNVHATHNTSFVTWPVLLALEVLNRIALEATMVAAIAKYREPMLQHIARTVASVVTTSPPSDFRLPGSSDLLAMAIAPRSGLEFLNDQDAPPLQPFFSAIRIAVICESNLIASTFDLSRLIRDTGATTTTSASAQSDTIARQCVQVIAPFGLQTFTSTMRHCREVELIQISLKSYHVLATIASRLRANLSHSRSASASVSVAYESTTKKMDDVALACLRALCAFSFPLPESVKGVASSGSRAGGHHSNHTGLGSSSVSSSSVVNLGDNDSEGNAHDESESCVVTLSWREVHAMKALFSAAHIMEEEMIEIEWCTLLEAFEIIVGLSDVKVKNGQNKIPTKNYRIGAFRVEDEDVEQQLAMLGNSIVELFRDALQLSSGALRRLTAALRKVCWEQLGLPLGLQQQQQQLVEPQSFSARRPHATLASIVTTDHGDSSNPSSTTELPLISATHQMKTYQNYLGIGLAGSGSYLPSFALRMLTQLATNSKRCFEDVTNELLAMVTYTLPPPATSTQFPQLVQFQVVATDSILQLMQRALQNVINSMSPTSKLPNDATIEQMEAHAKLFEKTEPHVFDQQELFAPLLKLMRSDMKDRALVGMLDLLNGCGHLINSGWPLVLQAIQEACEIGDGKSQVTAFKCLRVVVDDLLVSIPRMYLRHCVSCIGRFACCAKDVNISLTAVNELWSVADIIGKQKLFRPANSRPPDAGTTTTSSSSTSTSSYWACAFAELTQVALDDRTEVRNCAINTLFGTGVTYGVQFDLPEWKLFIDDTVLPLASKLQQGRALLSSDLSASTTTSKSTSSSSAVVVVMHHSRDSAQKQWDESRVLMLTGISRVLQTNCHVLLSHGAWFADVWTQLLTHIALNSETGMAKEVVLAAVSTLQTLLQVSSAADFDQIAQSQPVRAGAGMRVVGGALVAGGGGPTTPGSATAVGGAAGGGAKRTASIAAPFVRNPDLWETAFSQLLRLCDLRKAASQQQQQGAEIVWKEEHEQEIASAVVSVAVTLYSQAKEFEFKDARNVVRVLSLFETLVMRHVLMNSDGTSDPAAARGGGGGAPPPNVTTNSLQSRVLNAFEECGSFAAHPQVHELALDQLVKYVVLSATASRELVFFTRHALISLAKLYASVSSDARRERFEPVLRSVQPFLRGDATAAANAGSGAHSPEKKPLSAAQKAASQLWKHALRVLLVLISHGLAAVRLERDQWRVLLETITVFLCPGSGQLPSFVESEEDEALVLSVLECLVDSVIALLSGAAGEELIRDMPAQYQHFSDALMALLCSGVDGVDESTTQKLHSKPLIKCCVRQLATLSIQHEDARLSTLARTYLVRCCDAALRTFATLEQQQRALRRQTDKTSSTAIATATATATSTTTTTTATATTTTTGNRVRAMNESDGEQQEDNVAQVRTARDRVVILLSSTSEVSLGSRSVLEMFPALCTCITSSDLQVRTLIQRLLGHARIAEFCLDVLDVHDATVAAAAAASLSSSSSGSMSASRTNSGSNSSWSHYA